MKKVIKKKKQFKKAMQKGAIGNFFVFGVLALLIALGITAVGGLPSVSSPQNGTQVQIITPGTSSSHNVLQLETFGYTTLAPTPVTSSSPSRPITSVSLPAKGNKPLPIKPISKTAPTTPSKTTTGGTCPYDDDRVIVPTTCKCPKATLVCKNGKAYNPNGKKYTGPNPYSTSPCGTALAGDNGRYCVGKPVIYLYPTVPTYVTVKVITSGSIVVSNPAYPQGGWKNVLAYPGGNLEYQNQKYSELFYESSVTTFQKPDQGIVIPTAQLTQNLNGILSKLGLIGNEKKEFIDFWVPKLQTFNSPYIFFSVLSPSAKDAIDHVVITPKPETQIAFIAYFKPMNSPDYGTSLKFPPTPKRVGFTSVEWGGVIDNQ